MTHTQELTVNTIRILSAEAIQRANSGHPGLPMGAAPIAYTLFADAMNHNPNNPKWENRDRFVLSAGHGSMLLYSLLHLFGYGLSMDEIKNFRQLGSKTPGHPEYGHTVGVETTTGPLGQGIANAVGMAQAESLLAAKFNRPGYEVVDHYTYCLAGDGCMQEGVAIEAASLAGTWGLGKLILFYDSNDISIEGNINISFRDDVAKRFEAQGWHTEYVADSEDLDAILAAINRAKAVKDKPSMIRVKTVIGYGAPKEGTADVHGSPLGADGLAVAKSKLNWTYAPFEVPTEVYADMANRAKEGAAKEAAWNELVEAYGKAFPEVATEYHKWMDNQLPDFAAAEDLWQFADKPDATRNTSGIVLNKIANMIPNLVGGSADLAPSNKSYMNGKGDYSKETPDGMNMHFGVREHAMSAISNGMYLHGGLNVYCATFFVFSDYMKNAMRMSAIMGLPVTYVLTHDSIGVGEDGPTHEPVEHIAGLRVIPNMKVWRPADGKETTAAWIDAMTGSGPACLVLTRQDLPQYANSGKAAFKGGYILSDSEKKTPDMLLMASGSEVELAVAAQKVLKDKKIDARVVSMPCMEVFERQSEEYKESVLPHAVRKRVAIEAAVSQSWYKYVGLDGRTVCMDSFGASAPAPVLFEEFGFTVDNVVNKALELI